MARSIKQVIQLSATPHEVYEALMDSEVHSSFTGSRAVISRKVGGKFSTFDNYSTGTNLKLSKDKKIVQTWRANDWPEGALSKATFALKASKQGTQLTFTQTGVPDSQYKAIKQGWIDFYWKPMKEMFGKRKR